MPTSLGALAVPETLSTVIREVSTPLSASLAVRRRSPGPGVEGVLGSVRTSERVALSGDQPFHHLGLAALLRDLPVDGAESAIPSRSSAGGDGDSDNGGAGDDQGGDPQQRPRLPRSAWG